MEKAKKEEKAIVASTTIDVRRCDSCKPHAYQDRVYGRWYRVFNLSQKGQDKGRWKCTVCGKTKM
jgi:hypothetical protein